MTQPILIAKRLLTLSRRHWRFWVWSRWLNKPRLVPYPRPTCPCSISAWGSGSETTSDSGLATSSYFKIACERVAGIRLPQLKKEALGAAGLPCINHPCEDKSCFCPPRAVTPSRSKNLQLSGIYTRGRSTRWCGLNDNQALSFSLLSCTAPHSRPHWPVRP